MNAWYFSKLFRDRAEVVRQQVTAKLGALPLAKYHTEIKQSFSGHVIITIIQVRVRLKWAHPIQILIALRGLRALAREHRSVVLLG